MQPQAKKLRDLFASGEHFIAADAYSALTARIVEHVGFKAAYLGGHACSAFHYAVPDNGVFSQVEQIEQAARIAAAIDIPLIADADTLGETVADAFHFARRYARSGVAGIHVEDEVNPKHSSYVNGLASIPDMQARLEACQKGAGDSGLVVVARCDELYPNAYRGGGKGSLDEAIKRGKAYIEAGADALVFPLATAEATAELRKALSKPIVVLGAPIPGTACTLHTGWGWLGAAKLHLERARELFETGKVTADLNLAEKNALIEQDLFDELITDWAKKTGRETR
ncbi:MAG TPA: isocitrate lyase/PEP mutase family protein [Phenylobacterium sp.]|uniref:isocitrate lyase/PEP mutase family protein n=1 Tax=Phenylobacterium sp. TaxID=1871053 RepID=UPI002B49873B|nr:isocitrate lyase/PEP mutase family protein [Phenylobacterium sp.]HKR88895.1 isocitrate lyase/PEP mutase family protein [Phenylobacterium sp.]